MARKKDNENIVSEIKETTINNVDEANKFISKNSILADTHIKKALDLIKVNKKDEAKYEIDLAYNLDENNAYIYLAKLFLKFNLKSIEDLEKKANNKIINSSFFKASFELGDKSLKNTLNQIIENVEYKQVEVNLETADLEQLLKHLRVQKQKEIDYTYTISLILGILYRSFRYIDKEYIDENKNKDNFIPILKKMESSFQYYLDILYHFDDIVDIKDIISQCISDHRALLNYNLIILKELIESTTDEEKLEEIKEYIEITYLHHEADDLLKEIKPTKKKKSEFSLGALLAATFSFFIVLGFGSIGIITALFANNGPVTSNGVTYKKNDNNGYTIVDYDFSSTTVTFEDEIDGLKVNEIEEGIFYDSDIYKIENFPSGISYIPKDEFKSCDYLVSFSFSDKDNSLLTTIESGAFEDCTSLSSFVVTENVTDIGYNAFKNTPNLVYLTNNSDIDFDETYIGLNKREFVIDYDNDVEDYKGSYYSWDTLTLDVAAVSKTYYDFLGFKINDTSLIKPINNKITISCYGYYSLSIKASYETASLINDEYGVSYKLSSDKSHYIINSYSANDTNIVYLKDEINGIKVSELNPTCFMNNRKLEKIYNFPSYIETIKEGSFSGCISLNEFSFSDSETSELKRIEKEAFLNCSSLKSFILPTSVTYLGDDSFKGCDELLSFTNSYDWKNLDGNHKEAIRVGFLGRNYYLRDENEEIIEEGYYYINEEVAIFNLKKKGDLYKPYVFETSTNELYSSYDVNKTYFLYSVNNKESIDLTIKYDYLYSSSSYYLKVDQNEDVDDVIKGDSTYEYELSSKLFYLSNDEEVNDEYRVEYEIVEISNLLKASIEDNLLKIKKKQANQIATYTKVTYKAYLVSRFSDTKFFESINTGVINLYLG